jgi:hypothetical protein
MRRPAVLLCQLLFLAATLTWAASLVGTTMKNTHAHDLNGKALKLPADLPGGKTLLPQIAWLELPVINNPGTLGRWFIDSGMRRGVVTKEDRAHTVTVYTKKAEFLGSMGLADKGNIVAAVVDRSGRLLAHFEGRYEPEKAAALLAALKQ